MQEIEIIAIGNEILLGDVLDTNSNWLCQQFTRRGGRVCRVVQIRDEVEVIAREIRAVLERGADLVVTTGGLGPTDDDLTLHGLAEGLARPLEEHPEALTMIQQRYEGLASRGRIASATLTPARRKMAQLPQGAQPLHNPVGTAPGVLVQAGQTTLICLPGVPSELKAIFQGALADVWRERFLGHHYAEWVLEVHGGGESALAPLLREVVAAHPSVYVKSRAQDFDPDTGVRLLITLSMTGDSPAEVKASLTACLDDLQSVLGEAGAKVQSIRRDTAV